MEAGGCVGVGDDGYGDLIANDGGYGEADAFDGDGAFLDYVAGELGGNGEAEAPVGGCGVGVDWLEGEQVGSAIDVALDYVASEGRACWSGEFEVDHRFGVKVGEGGAGDGLGGEIGGEAWGEGVGLDVEGGEADSADGDAVAGVEAGDELRPSGDGDAGGSGGRSDREEGSGGFDQAGEHRYRLEHFRALGLRPRVVEVAGDEGIRAERGSGDSA